MVYEDRGGLGWTVARDEAFAPWGAAGLVPARVSLEHNHLYRVLAGGTEWLAETAGRVRHEATGRPQLPVVGDWVAVRPPPSADGRARVEAVLPRTSAVSRQAAGRVTGEQVMAANIDTLFLVSGLDAEFNLRRIERYLVVARRSGARLVVVLNKADVRADATEVLAEVSALAPDVPVHAVSTRTDAGLQALAPYLQPGRTVALLGSSGVGKSSIINRLLGRDALRTREVRPRDARGRHTSVHRQLLVLDDGALLIDTPGMRELQLWDAGDALPQSFPDVDALAGHCRFRDCHHDREPGCAVKAAVEQGRLARPRYESFLKLQAERAEGERRRVERERSGNEDGRPRR